ncbi:MAG: hypothetical protein ACRD2K_02325 [Terriglobales bacterium]
MKHGHSAEPPPRPRKSAAEERLEALVHSQSAEVLLEVAANPALTEDLALALLKRRDLPRGLVEILVKNGSVMKSRPVINAVARHPKTPRFIALPMLRHLYVFELMQIALMPGTPADLKMAAEENIVLRLETVSTGERMTLAKRASTRVAAQLLLDPETRIIAAALDNPYLTEAWIVKTLMNEKAPQAFVEGVCRHSKWPLRREVQTALLRNDKTPLARVLYFAQMLPTHVLKDTLRHSRLSASVKMYLFKELEQRAAKNAPPPPAAASGGDTPS